MLRAILRPLFRLDIDNTSPIALLAAGALWLAWAAPEATFLVVLLWGIALLALVSGLARASRHYRPDAPARPRPRPLQRLVYWAGTAALLAATAALFAAGHPALGTVVTVHLFGRLFDAAITVAQSLDTETITRPSIIRYEAAGIAVGIVAITGPLWIALGTPPGWAGRLIVVAWWLVLLTGLLTSSMALWSSVDNPLPYRLASRIFRIGDPSAERGGIPEIAGSRLLTTYCLFVPLVLAAAGMAGPGGLAVLLLLVIRAESAQRELIEAADAARPPRLGRIARANHFVVINAVQLVFSPVRHSSRLLGIGAAKEAAELRAAFGRPQGFIYFLWSEPLQRVPYLEQGSLLEAYADYIVERSWRRDIMGGVEGSARKTAARAAERRLLARHEILRKGTPFLVVVPPRGCPRAFRLAGGGMARWGKGDSGAQAIEFGVLSAITEAFGPGAGYAGFRPFSPAPRGSR